MNKKGVDLSAYNPVTDWAKVAEQVDFAILKVIRKDLSPDKKFAEYLSACKSYGIPLAGVYNYSYATTGKKAVQDAQAVVKTLGGLVTPVWLDIEDSCLTGLKHGLIDIILMYKGVIEGAGLPFGVYTGLAFYNANVKPYKTELAGIPMWIARYPSSKTMMIGKSPLVLYKPAVSPLWGWQYSSKGSVAGITGNVDLNIAYMDILSYGAPANVAAAYYPAYIGTSGSIIAALSAVGETDTSYAHRKKIALANGLAKYSGTAVQNTQLLQLLKGGRLQRA